MICDLGYSAFRAPSRAIYCDYVQALLTTLLTGTIGGLIGAYVVHLLTKSRDHSTWVRNSRIKEWQELLETLSEAYMALLRLPKSYEGGMGSVSDYNIRKSDALANVDVMLATRIFISDDVEQLNARKRWAALVTDFHKRTDKPTFMAAYQELHKDIVAKAKQTH